MIRKLAAFVFVLTGLAPCSLPNPVLSVQPNTLAAGPGGTVMLDITVTGVVDVYAYQLDFGFDPSVLTAMSISEGKFLGSRGATNFLPGTIDNQSGMISTIVDTLVGPLPGVSGSGVLATALFRTNGLGNSAVSLINVSLLDSTLSEIPVQTLKGQITVAETPEPMTPLLVGIGVLVISFLKLRANYVER